MRDYARLYVGDALGTERWQETSACLPRQCACVLYHLATGTPNPRIATSGTSQRECLLLGGYLGDEREQDSQGIVRCMSGGRDACRGIQRVTGRRFLLTQDRGDSLPRARAFENG